MFGGALLYSFYCMYDGNYDATTWILSYKLSVPFDITTVWGWYLIWIISTQIGIPYSLAMIALMSYFAGSCYHIIGICNHFKFVISSININSMKVGERYKVIKENLSHAVIIHNKLLECVIQYFSIHFMTFKSVVLTFIALLICFQGYLIWWQL